MSLIKLSVLNVAAVARRLYLSQGLLAENSSEVEVLIYFVEDSIPFPFRFLRTNNVLFLKRHRFVKFSFRFLAFVFFPYFPGEGCSYRVQLSFNTVRRDVKFLRELLQRLHL